MDTFKVAREALKLWGLPVHPALFKEGEGLALVANLVNMSAKVVDERFYQIKADLVGLAFSSAFHCWEADGVAYVETGVAYVETGVGQVSFHLWDEDWDYVPEVGRTPGEWAGGGGQARAWHMIVEWLGMYEDWHS
jgi:hypothetical protein